MAGNSRDVELVFKARDEATKALSSVSDALKTLNETQEALGQSSEKAGRGMGTLADAASNMERSVKGLSALGTVVSQIEKAAAGVTNLEAAVQTSTEKLAAAQTRYSELAETGSKLEGSISQVKGALAQESAELAKTDGALKNLQSQLDNASQGYSRLIGSMKQTKVVTEEQKQAYRDYLAAMLPIVEQMAPLEARQKAQRDLVADYKKELRELTSLLSANATQQDKSQTAVSRANSGYEASVTNLEKAKVALTEMTAAAEAASKVLGTPLNGGAIKEALDAAKAGEARLKQLAAERQINSALAERANLESAIERNTGLGRVPATQAGAGFGALAELAEKEKALEVEQRTLDADRQINSALAERARLEDAIARNTGAGRTSATQGGASYSALAEMVAKEEELRKATQEAAQAFQTLQDRLNPVDALTRRYEADLATLRAGMKATGGSAQQLAAEEAKLEAQFKRAKEAAQNTMPADGRPTLFGMKPYELTNLGYQINDVVSGLASGQRPMQIFAQQGGQILQLLPNLGQKVFALVTNFRAMAGLSIVIPTLIAIGEAIAKVADEAERVRDLKRDLAFSADASFYDPEQIAKAADQMHRFGVSAQEAQAAFKVFMAEGFRQDRFVGLTIAAKALSDATGKDLKESVKAVAEAFSGGAQKVLEFDKQVNFLTTAQREHIIQLMEQGKSVEAVNYAYGIFAQKAQEAEGHLSPMTNLTRSLSNAWSTLLEKIGNTAPIERAGKAMASLANDIAKGLDYMTNGETPAQYAARLETVIQNKKAAIDRLVSEGKGDSLLAQKVREEITGLQRQLDEAKAKAGPTATPQNGAGQPGNLKNGGTAISAKDMEKATEAERNLRIEQLRRMRQSDDQITQEEKLLRLAQARASASREVDGLQIPDAERQKIIAAKVAAEQEAINREEREVAKARGSAENQAKYLIENFENGGARFKPDAYKDSDGKWRMGYGSSTFTDEAGNVGTVKAGMSTTPEAAERDLERRIKDEFMPAAKREIGASFESFNAQQKAVVTSLIYNYGTLTRTKDGHGAGIDDILRHGTTAEIADAIRKLGDDNGGVNRNRRNREAAIFASPNPERDAFIKEQSDEVVGAQAKAGNALANDLAMQREKTAELVKQAKLQDSALLAEQVRYAGEKAVQDAIRQRETENVQRDAEKKRRIADLTQAELAGIRQAAEEEARAQNIRAAIDARINEKMRPVTGGAADVQALQAEIEYYRSVGSMDLAQSLIPQLQKLNADLIKARDAAIEMYRNLSPEDRTALGLTDQQVEALVSGLRRANAESKNLKTGLISAQEVNQEFARGGVATFQGLAKGVAGFISGTKSLGGAFREAKDAFLNFAASFLMKIAEMIMQAQILKLLQSIGLGGAVSGVANAAAGAASTAATTSSYAAVAATTSIAHAGGLAGAATGMWKPVSPAVFANAIRYHTGGMAGLKPNEVATVLERNEEILTEADPRHRFNLGKGGAPAPSAPPQDLKIINAFDAGTVISEAMNTTHGQRALVNFVRSNARAINGALKG